MKVRWSQLVYRRPGSDNAACLTQVVQTPQGESHRFADQPQESNERSVGYLALVPLASGFEEELDVWVELDPDAFLSSDRTLWEAPRKKSPKQLLRSLRLALVG